MSDERDTYDLEPTPEPKKERERRSIAEGLEEEIDREIDDEGEPAEILEKPSRPAKVKKHGHGEDEQPATAIAGNAWPGWQILVVVGFVLTALALVFAWRGAVDKHFLRTLLALYNIAIFTGLGAVAVFVAALLLGRPFGRIELAASRMFVAVSAYSALFHVSNDQIAHWAGWFIGALGYAVVVWGTFRLKRNDLLIVAGAHFALWLIVYAGMLLSRSL